MGAKLMGTLMRLAFMVIGAFPRRSRCLCGFNGVFDQMFPNPVVSVIMPGWNRARFVADAIRSVMGKIRADLELVVFGDGSADGSPEVQTCFTEPWLRRGHNGASAAMNASRAAGMAPAPRKFSGACSGPGKA